MLVFDALLTGLESEPCSCELSGWDELDDVVSLEEGGPPKGSADIGLSSSLDLSSSTGAAAVGELDVPLDLALSDPSDVGLPDPAGKQTSCILENLQYFCHRTQNFLYLTQHQHHLAPDPHGQSRLP